MRIISGIAKGRRLKTPARHQGRPQGKPRIRPTSDRAREAIFNIIGSRVIDATVLDLFAGTGALGLEALSRGAGFALFVDQDREALALIACNIELCRFSDRTRIIRADLIKGFSSVCPQAPVDGFDLVFIDPPYSRGLAETALGQLAADHLVAPAGLVVAEDASGETLPDQITGLALLDQRRYGDTGFWIYRMTSDL
ncbi:MAG: 16S rRNA (guanine(966)-N(2))-methyltransferase RsmD [Desulfobacterales bacterium]|nr:16S rRNA (guanine(966)-N(2))-methyltransferase RsmD [Desulfobacterales bacterium]